LTGIDLSVVKNEPDRMTVLPLSEILKIMLRHCREKYSELVEMRFNHKVVDVRQDETKVWATVQVGEPRQETTERIEADYLIGCDGGQSTVRKCLLQRNWPGETFESRLLVQNVGTAMMWF
jgi:2-polyprenyl-6-methoxyphenol hydroxylase-like FAD-dependent oxidoreductase